MKEGLPQRDLAINWLLCHHSWGAAPLVTRELPDKGEDPSHNWKASGYQAQCFLLENLLENANQESHQAGRRKKKNLTSN